MHNRLHKNYFYANKTTGQSNLEAFTYCVSIQYAHQMQGYCKMTAYSKQIPESYLCNLYLHILFIYLSSNIINLKFGDSVYPVINISVVFVKAEKTPTIYSRSP